MIPLYRTETRKAHVVRTVTAKLEREGWTYDTEDRRRLVKKLTGFLRVEDVRREVEARK